MLLGALREPDGQTHGEWTGSPSDFEFDQLAGGLSITARTRSWRQDRRAIRCSPRTGIPHVFQVARELTPDLIGLSQLGLRPSPQVETPALGRPLVFNSVGHARQFMVTSAFWRGAGWPWQWRTPVQRGLRIWATVDIARMQPFSRQSSAIVVERATETLGPPLRVIHYPCPATRPTPAGCGARHCTSTVNRREATVFGETAGVGAAPQLFAPLVNVANERVRFTLLTR
jgi:hypothetical protein